jgi:hypothetical protein
MCSIIQNGDNYRGISVVGRGVFANDEDGIAYAGQHRDGYACGLGVLKYYNGNKVYAEYGPDGWYDGRYFVRWANGSTFYFLYERGERKADDARSPTALASSKARPARRTTRACLR